MIVYVETNFVLELALVQEEHAHCQQLVGLCEGGQIALVAPAFSFAEPYETLKRRHRQRRTLLEALSRELKQLARSHLYHGQTDAMDQVMSLLAKSAEDEKGRLDATVSRLLNSAETIPLDRGILELALKCQHQHDLSPQDAVVFASVIHHVKSHEPEPSCFLNKNAKEFSNPNVLAAFAEYDCRLLFKFADGLAHVRARLKAGSGP